MHSGTCGALFTKVKASPHALCSTALQKARKERTKSGLGIASPGSDCQPFGKSSVVLCWAYHYSRITPYLPVGANRGGRQHSHSCIRSQQAKMADSISVKCPEWGPKNKFFFPSCSNAKSIIVSGCHDDHGLPTHVTWHTLCFLCCYDKTYPTQKKKRQWYMHSNYACAPAICASHSSQWLICKST